MSADDLVVGDAILPQVVFVQYPVCGAGLFFPVRVRHPVWRARMNLLSESQIIVVLNM
jgi:hypothetical protein